MQYVVCNKTPLSSRLQLDLFLGSDYYISEAGPNMVAIHREMDHDVAESKDDGMAPVASLRMLKHPR